MVRRQTPITLEWKNLRKKKNGTWLPFAVLVYTYQHIDTPGVSVGVGVCVDVGVGVSLRLQ